MRKISFRILTICLLLCSLCCTVSYCDETRIIHDMDNTQQNAEYTIFDGVLTWYSEYNTNTSFSVPDGVKEIGEGAFIGNNYLEEIIFPEGLLVIGDDAFDSCTKLKTVQFPESLLFIGGGAFESCWGLTDLQLPSKLLVIGNSAFAETGELGEVIIPKRVEVIGESAFMMSHVRKIVILPNNAIYISDDLVNYDADCTIVLTTEESDFAELIIIRYSTSESVHVVICESSE